LVATNPLSTDPVSKGDNHLRMIKDVLQKSFPSDIQVHIPDTAGQDGKFLKVDGVDPVWDDFPDLSSLISRVGEYQRANFTYIDGDTISISPCNYHVYGVGNVNIDNTITKNGIPGSNTTAYLYLDKSVLSTSTFMPNPYTRISVDDSCLYWSSDEPTFVGGTQRRGWYHSNGEDRCIFQLYKDGNSIIPFYHNGNEYVQYKAEEFLGYITSSASTSVIRKTPLKAAESQINMLLRAAGNTGTLGDNFFISGDNSNWHNMGRVEAGYDVVDDEHVSNNIRIHSVNNSIYGRWDGPNQHRATIYATGFYLPGGM
ncbi:MAG: hypothetical protein VW683_15480, partial [Betaproteobacteria bacterium]